MNSGLIVDVVLVSSREIFNSYISIEGEYQETISAPSALLGLDDWKCLPFLNRTKEIAQSKLLTVKCPLTRKPVQALRRHQLLKLHLDHFDLTVWTRMSPPP